MVRGVIIFFSSIVVGGLADDASRITAGPFEITVPALWAKTAIVEKVPVHPLYSEKQWKEYLVDRNNALKPSFLDRPEHWAIRLPASHLGSGLFDSHFANEDESAPQILIHRAEQWESIGRNGSIESSRADEFTQRLKENLVGPEKRNDVRSYYPAYGEGAFAFLVLRKRVDFRGGFGFRMLGQWNVDCDFARRGGMLYLFLGFSNDNTCQIIASIPITLPGLKEAAQTKEHLGFHLEPYDRFVMSYEAYEEAVQRWLSGNSANIQPSLVTLDAMIASLRAETWK